MKSVVSLQCNEAYYIVYLIKGEIKMKKLSMNKLSEIVKNQRTKLGYTQEKLSDIIKINRIMIGRIERKEYTPSIQQIELLAQTLNFDIIEMFEEDNQINVFTSMRSKTLSDTEQAGVDTLFSMMLFLKQQIALRSLAEHE
jgi:transcriptional regulator with XRE-family HTH domain